MPSPATSCRPCSIRRWREIPSGRGRTHPARRDDRWPTSLRYHVNPQADPARLPRPGGLRHVHAVQRRLAVGEALNILETFDLSGMSRGQALHHYLEASALAFADRNRYVGDGTSARILRELLCDRFAAERACRIDPATALAKPVAPGVPDGSGGHALRWPPPRR